MPLFLFIFTVTLAVIYNIIFLIVDNRRRNYERLMYIFFTNIALSVSCSDYYEECVFVDKSEEEKLTNSKY